MKARDIYRVLRRMDRIAAHLDDPEVRGTQMNMRWIHWMGYFGDAMDRLPRGAYDLLANDPRDMQPYASHFEEVFAAVGVEP